MSRIISTYIIVSFFFFLYCGMKIANGDVETQTKMDEIVNFHNHLRRHANASNMNMLKWNETLAEMAHEWAVGCVFLHGQPETNHSFQSLGQNLFVKIPGKLKVNYTEAIDEFHNEYKNYTFENGSCSGVCGHYTQVVWADSVYVGCASTFCPFILPNKIQNVTYVVCNYGPAGNFPDSSPYEKGDPCDMCIDCVDGLCIPDYD